MSHAETRAEISKEHVWKKRRLMAYKLGIVRRAGTVARKWKTTFRR